MINDYLDYYSELAIRQRERQEKWKYQKEEQCLKYQEPMHTKWIDILLEARSIGYIKIQLIH